MKIQNKRVPTDPRHMIALARMDQDAPEFTSSVLHDSGFGELADDWLQATQEFSRAASDATRSQQEEDGNGARPNVLVAYARRCVSWARISQLRDQARRSMEQLP